MRILIFVILSIIIIGCNKQNRCFDRPGELTTITTSFDSSINAFTIYDDLNIVLVHDSLNTVIITGGKNMVNNVLFITMGDEMSISNSNKCLFLSNNDEIEVTVHYTNLSQLSLNGYGNISFDLPIVENLKLTGQDCYSSILMNLNNDSTVITLEGAPQINATGSCNYLYAYTVGKGNYFMQDLQSHHAHGHNRGIGDIHLKADSSYIVELRSRGDIYLHDTTGIQTFIVLEGDGSIYIE